MAQFSQQEQNAMRREAARRAREMQKRVYFGKQQGSSPYADYPPEEPPQEKTPSPKTGMPCWEIWHSFAPRGSCPDWTVTPC